MSGLKELPVNLDLDLTGKGQIALHCRVGESRIYWLCWDGRPRLTRAIGREMEEKQLLVEVTYAIKMLVHGYVARRWMRESEQPMGPDLLRKWLV